MGIKCLAGPFSCYKEPPKEFICDTDADFDNLPEACTGSTAISLWSKKERVVNTKGIWRPYGECFVGAPIIDLIKEGGGLVEGETYTFKNNLNDIDPNDFMKTPETSGPIAGESYSVAMFSETSMLAYLTSEGFDYMFNTKVEGVAPAGAWMVANENGYYAYLIKHYNDNSEIIDNNVGWLSVVPGNPDGTPVDFVPITISDFNESFGGYSLDELAVFFDIESKTSLVVTDTNDEGIVASYEVYADEALVDTVPKAETIDATALGVTAGASVTVKAKSIIDTTSEASNAVIFE